METLLLILVFAFIWERRWMDKARPPVETQEPPVETQEPPEETQEPPEEDDPYRDRVAQALKLIMECSKVGEVHHQQWVLDQVVRILAEDWYPVWVREFEEGENGPSTYQWSTGTTP